MCDRVGLYCHLNVILVQKLRDCQITGRGEYCSKGERFWKKMWERQKQSLWFLFRLYLLLCRCWCVSVFSERWHSSIRRRLQGVCCTSSDRINGYRAVAKLQGGTRNHQCGDYKLRFTLFFSSNKAAAAAPTQLCLSVFTSQYANSDAFSKC